MMSGSENRLVRKVRTPSRSPCSDDGPPMLSMTTAVLGRAVAAGAEEAARRHNRCAGERAVGARPTRGNTRARAGVRTRTATPQG